MHRRIDRPSADIQLFCKFVDRHSCFEESVPCLFLHSVRLWLWLDDPSALHQSHSYGHFKTFQSTHTRFYVREHCPHTEHACADKFIHLVQLLPTKNISQIVAPSRCNSQVSLPCSPLCSNSHTNCKVNRLASPTSHMTPHNTSPPPPLPLFPFFSKI
jgi:hypothetical protein